MQAHLKILLRFLQSSGIDPSESLKDTITRNIIISCPVNPRTGAMTGMVVVVVRVVAAGRLLHTAANLLQLDVSPTCASDTHPSTSTCNRQE